MAGYLNQSSVFKNALDGNQTAAIEAAKYRRGADYRRRQEAAILKLEQEIAEFEATMLSTKNNNNGELSFK